MEYAASIRDRFSPSLRSTGFNKLASEADYLPADQLALIRNAFDFAAAAHEGQKRASGGAYITHPVAVARILASMHLDWQSLAAALLHDVVEDTPVTLAELEDEFGAEVAALVDGVSKLDKLNFSTRTEAQVESFRKMMLAMVEDIRVILVKLADRLHNMRTLDAVSPAKQRRIAKETLEIYAPIANRLGINKIKNQLEDLGFRHAYPFRYKVLEKTLKKAQGNHKQIVKRISERLQKSMDEAGIEVHINGRKKHLYSIYKKMIVKKRTLAEIADVFGFRIIAKDVDSCYRVLGRVHQIYKPMPGRFKDYIAIPRVNGYQSLHTTLFGPSGIPVEVQIRTDEMDHLAESGLASHWQYKAVDPSLVSPQARAREWLASVMELQASSNSEEFMENVKVDLFPDKAYVFTPKGEILRLPRGSTCVDFAYAVHTDVGNRCVAAKVDRRLVPLRTVLKNGQTVQIITSKGASPNPGWVNFVVTAKARTSIRQYLRSMRRDEAVELGRRLLDQALRDQGSSLRRLGKQHLQDLLEEMNVESAPMLYEQLGMGERLAPLVAQMLLQRSPDVGGDGDLEESSRIAIAGTEGMVVTYARCCHPIPGDNIIGYMTSGRGVVIHRDICGNLQEYRKQPNKWIAVQWQPAVDSEFPAEIKVEVANEPGVLAKVASRIADTGSNIEQVAMHESDDDDAELIFTILVKNRVALARVIKDIRHMSAIKRVSRTMT